MRKLTSLKKIEFVGIAVPSDETKEIVAMMCQIYSRACSVLIWLGTGQPATARTARTQVPDQTPHVWCSVLHISCSWMTSDLIGMYWTIKNRSKMATILIGYFVFPPFLN